MYLGTPVGRFKLPADPKDTDKILAVITATEGGNYMAINMYDRGIVSVGIIQWIEAGQYSVSSIFGKLMEADSFLLTPVLAQASLCGYDFVKNVKGNWRFLIKETHAGLSSAEVDTESEQQRLFFLNSNGQIGTWNADSKLDAEKWAASIATVFENPAAQRVQADYTVKRLGGFALPYATKMLASAPNTNIGNAFKAAYLSFAANNPTWANKHLQISQGSWSGELWTIDWLIHVLTELTFGPKIVIYPHRYNAIRPVLERLYSLNLPDLSTELEKWKMEQPHDFFYDTKEIQQALLLLGYDLGPAKDDGVYGNKTREAVLLFEQADFGEKNKVPPEHVDGMVDEWTARKLEEVLERRGKQILELDSTSS